MTLVGEGVVAAHLVHEHSHWAWVEGELGSRLHPLLPAWMVSLAKEIATLVQRPCTTLILEPCTTLQFSHIHSGFLVTALALMYHDG